MDPLAAVILRASCQNSRPFFITIVDYSISTTSGVEPIIEATVYLFCATAPFSMDTVLTITS